MSRESKAARQLRQYTSGMWPDVSEDLAQKMLELRGGSVWRFRPPSSPEWPSGLWSYAVGAEDLTEAEIEEWIAEKYIGDWAPDKVRWTIERLDRVANPKPSLPPSQRRRLREKAVTGRMLFSEEDDDDDEEAIEARPGPRGHHPSLTEIPSGTPVRRMPPGAAGGATPFDWPNPTMTVVANKARGKLHRPKLIDARKMAKKHPGTFGLPSKKAVSALGVGDFAKVSTAGERFWVRVIKRDGNRFQGIVDNDVLMTKDHGLQLGDRMVFESKNLYDAVSKERMARAHAAKLSANPGARRRRNERRRSDMIGDLDKRLRRIKGHLDSVEDILERGKPSVGERETLLIDKDAIRKTIDDLEDQIAQLEMTIELEGDIVGELPPRHAWGVPRSRNQGQVNMERLEKFTSKELKKMPTLSTSQADDLKHDDGQHRWWLDRVGAESGATHRVAVEELVDGRWKVVHQYEPYRKFNTAATAERLKRF